MVEDADVLGRLLIMMRRWIWPAMLLVVILIVSLYGVSVPYLDRFGSYIMVAAALGLALVAGKRSQR
jgi:hypothetical protein